MNKNATKKEFKKKVVQKRIQNAIAIFIGAIIMGIGLEAFLLPNNMMDGGITGISIMIAELTGWNVGLFLFVLNIPFIVLGYKQIGTRFAISSVFGIVVLSCSTVAFHHIKPFTDDQIMAALFGGMMLGLGIGLVIRFGGTLDGTEILGILGSKRLPFSVGEIVMVINAFIFAAGAFVFGANGAMYSVVAYFVAFKTMDLVIQGMDESKSALIITEYSEDMASKISLELGRGATFIQGKGAHTKEETDIVFTVINRLEEAKLKDIVKETDPDAFFIIGNISEVRGGQFKKKDIH